MYYIKVNKSIISVSLTTLEYVSSSMVSKQSTSSGDERGMVAGFLGGPLRVGLHTLENILQRSIHSSASRTDGDITY